MNNELFRECELKFKIQNENIEYNLLNNILNNGFIFSGNCIQTDFILDTNKHLCRKNNLLFRIRQEVNPINKNAFLLITLKIKGISKDFQDNYEIEYRPMELVNDQNLILIINELESNAKIKLNPDYLLGNNFENMLSYLFKSGFSEYGVLQKKRRCYTKNNILITVDVFPDTIGTFLEIEASNESDLYKTVDLLNLSRKEMERRNYGKIILEKHKICIFQEHLFMNSDTKESLEFKSFMNLVMRNFSN